MATSFLMPNSCKVCNLPFCAMSVVACLSTLLQLPTGKHTLLLSWLNTHAVSSVGLSWRDLLCGVLTCHRPQSTLRSCKTMCRMPLLGPLLPIGLPRLSSMSLGLPVPFPHDGLVLMYITKFCRHATDKSRVLAGLHASARCAPSKGAKLCTYHC